MADPLTKDGEDGLLDARTHRRSDKILIPSVTFVNAVVDAVVHVVVRRYLRRLWIVSRLAAVNLRATAWWTARTDRSVSLSNLRFTIRCKSRVQRCGDQVEAHRKC